MKFLVDVCVGRKIEQWLKDNNYDIKAVRDENPKMADYEILNWSVRENRILITMDKDFGELVYNSKLAHVGVLLLRLEDETGKKKVEVITSIMNDYADKLVNHFCVYQNGKIRIRK